MNNKVILKSSFRDPAGHLFHENEELYRQVNHCYQNDYEELMNSGLYQHLTDKDWLIAHEEVSTAELTDPAYKLLKPEVIPFISYPYEWCFSALKEAALLTLKIHRAALKKGMSLKDASAFNVQQHHGNMVFIDTLSFEKFEPTPWVAYRQFCQHFLAPLALMAHTDISLNKLASLWIDGIPLTLASKLLPVSSYFKLSTLLHIHMHALSQKKYENAATMEKTIKPKPMDLRQHLALVDQLSSSIKKLTLATKQTTWSDYVDQTNYSTDAAIHKQECIKGYLTKIGEQQEMILDLGANTGNFSLLAANYAETIISADFDELAIEKNYNRFKESDKKNIVPLIIDVFNPTPAIGWDNTERMSFSERCKADTVLALALIHHIAIGNNVPLATIAEFLAKLGKHLIIEFVPKPDSQVQRMLATRNDIFPDYEQQQFEKAFSEYFQIIEQENIKESERVLYLMKLNSL